MRTLKRALITLPPAIAVALLTAGWAVADSLIVSLVTAALFYALAVLVTPTQEELWVEPQPRYERMRRWDD